MRLQALWEGLDNTVQDRLNRFAELVFQYRKAARLTALKTEDEVKEILVLESLALKPMLEGSCEPVADLGSGSGIPGIPLAIALAGTPFTLYERSARKSGFLRIAIGALNLENATIEQQDPLNTKDIPRYRRLVARASVNPRRISEATAKMLEDGGEMFGFLSDAMARHFGDKLPLGLRLTELRRYTGASRSGFVYRLKWEAAAK